jgi:predicted nuclease with TOPRIM domain
MSDPDHIIATAERSIENVVHPTPWRVVDAVGLEPSINIIVDAGGLLIARAADIRDARAIVDSVNAMAAASTMIDALREEVEEAEGRVDEAWDAKEDAERDWSNERERADQLGREVEELKDKLEQIRSAAEQIRSAAE